MTGDTSMLLNLETCIQQWLVSAGLISDGPEISAEIKRSPNKYTTGIIHIDLCVKSLDTEATTEANLQPSPSRPTSPSQSSSNSSLNTSTLSLVIYDGTDGPTMNSRRLGSLLPLLEERGGSLEGVTIRLLNEKVSLTIPKEVLPTS